MKVEKIRIQHFQSIVDTGEIPLDDRLTILVGANESGKTAILTALWYFNPGRNFQDADISTLSGIREALIERTLSKDNLEIVTVWLTLSDDDVTSLDASGLLGTLRTLKVTKTLDNEYHIDIPTPPSPTAATPRAKLLALLAELKARLEKVYKGRVKRKLPGDFLVWVEGRSGEPERDNLVLFPEWAPHIWEDLKTGDWIQVTQFAEDPYGRNTRALNGGFDYDVQPIVSALSELSREVQSEQPWVDETFQDLQRRVNEIPQYHPLAEFLNVSTMGEILRLSQAGAPIEYKPERLIQRVIDILPEFLYLPVLPEMSDSVSLRSLAEGSPQQSDALLVTLTKVAGLKPEAVVQENAINRQMALDDSSRLLSARMRKHWINDGLSLEFLKDGQRLSIWVNASRSGGPPSRRSKGLSYYFSLFAALTELSAKKNVVALLDDAGSHLHPTAQKKILPLLDSQLFQIIMATHLPFMIDPDRVERVRVVARTEFDTKVEHDWTKAKDSLLPVWGSIIGGNTGRVWVVMEGKDEKRSYSRLSATLAMGGRTHLPEDVILIPGGGSNLVHVTQELLSRGIPTIVLTDGDKSGLTWKAQVLALPNVKPGTVLSLNEIHSGISNPRLENLFWTKEDNAKALSGREETNFCSQTLDAFERVIAKINEAIKLLG